MLTASTCGPSTTEAAPFAVEVWSGCRLSTLRPHRLQQPWWLTYFVTCGFTGGMSTTYWSSVPCSSTSPPQNGQGPSGTSTSASTCSGTGRCAGGCPGFRPGFFGSLLRSRRRNGAACRFRPRCACSKRRFRSLFSSTSRAFSSFSASFSVRSRAHSDRSNRFSARRARLARPRRRLGCTRAVAGCRARRDLATASDHPAYIHTRGGITVNMYPVDVLDPLRRQHRPSRPARPVEDRNGSKASCLSSRSG